MQRLLQTIYTLPQKINDADVLEVGIAASEQRFCATATFSQGNGIDGKPESTEQTAYFHQELSCFIVGWL